MASGATLKNGLRLFQKVAQDGSVEVMAYNFTLQTQNKAEASAAILDSQSIRTAEDGSDRGFNVHKHCLGRKRHILVDTLGLLLAALVTGANVQDRDGARELLSNFYVSFLRSFRLEHIWADAGYQGELISWT